MTDNDETSVDSGAPNPAPTGEPTAAQRARDPLAGLEQLGRYKIHRELGRGAMGVVYEAEDPKIGRQVALKVLLNIAGLGEAEEEEFRSRFFREARTAGRLAHPNIVVIHDVDHDEDLGTSYMAMEFLTGQSVYDHLRSGVKFTREQAVDICIQTAEGLDHAHRQGVTHRDVKPANLMYLEDGTIKIADFGIAKVSTSNLTKTGQFLGTPNYMSPEQVIGHAIDGRSDLFSLGIILYELLTGEKPFMGSSLTTITYQIVNIDPIEPSKILPGIPKVYDEIVGKLLKKAPDERWQTGKEVADALRAASGAGAAGALPPEQLGSEDATQIAGPPTVSGTAIGAPPGSVAAPSPTGGAPADAAPAAGGGKSKLPALVGVVAVLLLGAAGVLIGKDFFFGKGGTDPGGDNGTVVTNPADTGNGDPGSGGTDGGSGSNDGGGSGNGGSGSGSGSDGGSSTVTPDPPRRDPDPPRTVDRQPETTTRQPNRPVRDDPPPRNDPVTPPPVYVPPPVVRTPDPVVEDPTPTEPASDVGLAAVTVLLEHKLKSGRLRIDVDGQEVAVHDFTADKKRGGSEQYLLDVPEGRHVLRLCLESSELKEAQSCAHRQHQFVMNRRVTVRASHERFLRQHKFFFDVQ
ncbi:MAG: serine/threonine-protein kinase [Acidobacteriota bacterium]